ncbi:transcriptional regulator [Nocardia sp. MDA0666]|uniref:PucR family transcriptional regulator n=1 Tax=Nocardia sp. MDA0666 TaxID=2135448 RepID=UPI000D124B80|nr:helix-turn-helix domain-containing protein [Nocardia sp. MDA0666]PSR69250.1 transcriptional regulator [Nocardia sp. MDA0666]
MPVTSPYQQGLTVSGRPVSLPLKDVRALSRQMVSHFVETVAPCGTLPGDAIHGDITIITRVCLELAVSMLDGSNIAEKTGQLKDAAAQWAREGVPIGTIHHAIHEGFKIGFDLVVSTALAKQRASGSADADPMLSTADYQSILDAAKLVVEMLDTMTTAVSVAYVRELRAVVSEHHTAVHTLTSALLGGHPTSTMARECGIDIAGRYRVLALAIPSHPDESNPTLNAKVVARRKLRRLQAELATHCDDTVLSLLSIDGGTVLIPADRITKGALEELIGNLSRAARVPITATMVTAATDTLPTAADQAHELLDVVSRLGSVPGLYHFDDLALEYQLTRPGPGRDHLGSLLDPLDEHPELLETLQVHIAHNLNRQRTARLLNVHINTVDYRLKRIGQLTGFDSTQASGLWHLRSALVAHTYRT